MTTADGQTFDGDYLVLAAGSQAELLPHARRRASTPSRSTPSTDASALRTRLFEVFEDADADPARIDEGALNIVVVGGGPDRRGDGRRGGRPRQQGDAARASTTSTSTAAASTSSTTGRSCSAAFSEKAHAYAGEQARATTACTCA